MEAITYSLTLNDPPSSLLAELRSVLEEQGTPEVRADQDAETITFTGETAEFMVRARAADALTTVWPDWQHAIRD